MDVRRQRDVQLCALAVAIMATFAVVQYVALDVRWLRRLELSALDAQIRWRGLRPPGPETVVVMIDDQTIVELGRWPVPRRRIADLIDLLHRAGAKAIGIDVLFAEAERDLANETNAPGGSAADAALVRAIAQAGNVVLPFTFTFDKGPDRPAAPDLSRAAYVQLREGVAHRPLALQPTGILAPFAALAAVAALGHMTVAYDVDGAPRYDYPVFEYDLDSYPSMAVRVAQIYLDVPWSGVSVDLGRGLSLGRVYVPTDSQMRLLVSYPGPSRTFPTYPFSQVLSGSVPDSVFRNRIVLVGANALGSHDTFPSPFTAVMPGVERLAAVVDSILHEHPLRRPDAIPWLEIIALLATGLVMGFAQSRLSIGAASLSAFALVAAFAASAQIALARFDVWLASALPVIAIVITFTALSLYRHGLLDRDRRQLRRAFQRYLAPSMVDRLVDSRELPKLGGELRELTILFCDLRGFTALSERLEPIELTRVVNRFFSVATEAIVEYGGTVDKYIGDAVMAFWNAPLDQPDHPVLACRAALRIRERLDDLNTAAARDGGFPQLAIGIGINTGPCTVGNFGSSRRFDYSAMGDTVNVAARLEGETKTWGVAILLGPEAAAQVPGFATLPVDRLQLRGRNAAIEVHVLVGDEQVMGTPEFLDLQRTHLELRAALVAGNLQASRHLVAELCQRAPEELRPLYDVLARRAEAGQQTHSFGRRAFAGRSPRRRRQSRL